MSNKAKYELTGETKLYLNRPLYRIRALRDIPSRGVKKGDLGGWIEKEENLSQEGTAWVGDDAKISGGACVEDDARVADHAVICGDAVVRGYAKVLDYALIGDGAKVLDDAVVRGYAMVCGYALVYGNAQVYGYARLYDSVRVYGEAKVFGNACVRGLAQVYGSADIGRDACVQDNAVVRGNARVGMCAVVDGRVDISGNAVVESEQDYMVIKNCWSSNRWFTYTRSNKMWNVGCFHGTGEELIKKAYADSEDKGKCYEAIVRAAETIESVMSPQATEKK